MSGGMDSCVCAAAAAREFDVLALHVTYGQRTADRERRAFEALANHFGVAPERRLVADIAHLAAIGGSALTDEAIAVPEDGIDEVAVPVTYVPFRNAHLLSIATSWAEVRGASRIFIGAVEEDSSGYPDCRAVFYEAFGRAIDLGTRPETRIRIETPIIGLSKPGIVRLGAELEAPFHLTWSCYQRSDIACGACDSCRLRIRAFAEAGVPDPIPYVSQG
jgi:7-cyano-7-deazaguanine synthase